MEKTYYYTGFSLRDWTKTTSNSLEEVKKEAYEADFAMSHGNIPSIIVTDDNGNIVYTTDSVNNSRKSLLGHPKIYYYG